MHKNIIILNKTQNSTFITLIENFKHTKPFLFLVNRLICVLRHFHLEQNMRDFRNSDEMFVNYDKPLKVINTIFLCWGFISVVNALLLKEFGIAIGLEKNQISNFGYIFFGTYFLLGIPAGYLVYNLGFKRAIQYGLIVAGSAVFLIVPGARSQEVTILSLGIFVLAGGFTILQVACNPFIIFTGNKKLGSTRLSFAGGHNSIGSWIAPLVGILVSNIDIPDSVITSAQIIEYKTEFIILPYVLIAVIFAGMTVLVHYSDLPDFNNFKDIKTNVKNDNQNRLIIQYPKVWWGFFAIFAYVGAEVGIISNLPEYLKDHLQIKSFQESVGFIAPYFLGAMLVGRFIGGHMLRTEDPKKLLRMFAAFAAILTVISALLDTQEGMFSILALGFFNGIMWPVIFALTIQGMGRMVPFASGFLIMGISGGVLIPFLMTYYQDNNVLSLSQSLYLPAIAYIFIVIYTILGIQKPDDAEA